MKFGKKNEVSLSPLDYNVIMLGESGIGKTSTMFEVCQKLAGDDGYLFLECGNEAGADAIAGINYVTIPCYEQEYDEDMNTIGLINLVDDICENKSTDWADLKVLVIDTIDQIFPILEQESIRVDNRERKKEGKPAVKSINSAHGGYMKGQDFAIGLGKDIEARLNKVGVRLWKIGHCKTRTLTDAFTEEPYIQLTAKLEQRYFSAIKDEAHIMGLCYIDRDMIREKRREGSKEMVNRVKGEERKIKFRSSDYVVDNKSRFADIVEEIPLDADEFIKAFEDAIKAEANKSVIPIAEQKKTQAKAKAKKAEKIAEQEVEAKAENELGEMIEQITEFIKANKSDMQTVKPIMSALKAINCKKPSDISSVEDAMSILALCE